MQGSLEPAGGHSHVAPEDLQGQCDGGGVIEIAQQAAADEIVGFLSGLGLVAAAPDLLESLEEAAPPLEPHPGRQRIRAHHVVLDDGGLHVEGSDGEERVDEFCGRHERSDVVVVVVLPHELTDMLLRVCGGYASDRASGPPTRDLLRPASSASSAQSERRFHLEKHTQLDKEVQTSRQDPADYAFGCSLC